MNWFSRWVNPSEIVWVSLKSGDSIKGVLVERTREHLMLRAAKLGSIQPVTDAQVWTAMTGDVVVPLANIEYWQTGLPATVLE